MTLAADEFMRRFLLHVLPGGFIGSALRPAGDAPAAQASDDGACLAEGAAPEPVSDDANATPLDAGIFLSLLRRHHADH